MDTRKALTRGLVVGAVMQVLMAGLLLSLGARLEDMWIAVAVGVPAFGFMYVMSLLFDASSPKRPRF
jgi:hypothetical protein